ncbi:MAG: hypothetical protein PHR83_07120 [Paludibacter sp.]|nr:hypothetical protein [Paludibacter sp.]
MEIDEKIIQETTHCRRHFECLKADKTVCLNGKVSHCVNGESRSIKCNEVICHYRMNFGKYTICNCPTRKEIYRIKKTMTPNH